jgi:hypothetical protein
MNIELKSPSTFMIETSTQDNNSAFYYLMKHGFILRLEKPIDKETIPLLIKANLFDPDDISALNQEQANYRVAIFRDEILELDEYNQRVFGHSTH